MPDIEDGPVTSPADADIANELASSPTAQGMGPAPDAAAPQTVSAGSSLSYKGSTEHGKKYAAGLFGQAEKASDEFAAQDAARTAADTATMQRDYAGVKQATQGEIGATNEYAGRNQDLLQKKLEFNQLAAAAEERAHLESVAERQKYLANYQEQLAGVRALSMTTGNPIGGMSKGEEFGLMGAQFAEGFLGARYGVHIDVAGQVDRWINRSIQEHQMKIQNARQGAEDQLHLYEIARQNSQDDWEARQRYRGFVIQGLQTQIEMNAGRYQSKLANAQAGVSLAKLQVEADQTARQIGDAHQTRALQEKHMMLDEAYKQGMLGVEQYKAAIEAKKVAAQKPQPTAAPIFFSDNSQVQKDKQGNALSGGKFMWGVRSEATNIPKEAISKGLEEAHQTTVARDDLREAAQRYRELRAQIDKFGGPDKIRLYPEKARWAEQQRVLIANSLKKGLEGLRGSDADQARFEKMVAPDSWLQQGDNKALIDNLDEWSAEHYRHAMNSNPALYKVGDVGTEAPPAPYDRKQVVDPGASALGDTLLAPPPSIGTPARAEAEITSPKRDLAGADSMSSSLKAYAAQSGKPIRRFTATSGSDGPRDEFVGIDRLALAAADPERLIQSENTVRQINKVDPVDEDPKELKDASLKSLHHIANGYTSNGQAVSEEVRDYAKWVLNHIEGPDMGQSVGDLFMPSGTK